MRFFVICFAILIMQNFYLVGHQQPFMSSRHAAACEALRDRIKPFSPQCIRAAQWSFFFIGTAIAIVTIPFMFMHISHFLYGTNQNEQFLVDGKSTFMALMSFLFLFGCAIKCKQLHALQMQHILTDIV